MTRTGRLRDVAVLGQREDACGGDDPFAANDDATVVERRAVVEQVLDQEAVDLGVDAHAAFGEAVEGLPHLERDQRAFAALRHRDDRVRDLLDHIAPIGAQESTQQSVVAEAHDPAAQFGVEQDRQHDDGDLEDRLQHVLQFLEFQVPRDAPQAESADGQGDRHTTQHSRSARGAQERDHQQRAT